MREMLLCTVMCQRYECVVDIFMCIYWSDVQDEGNIIKYSDVSEVPAEGNVSVYSDVCLWYRVRENVFSVQ